MKTLVDSVTRWDVVFATAIFGLNGRRFLSFAMPWISHTGNGYYYPAVPAALLFVNSQKAWIFFLTGMLAFAIELPLYKLLKNGIKRNRPCEALSWFICLLSSQRTSWRCSDRFAASSFLSITAFPEPRTAATSICGHTRALTFLMT